MKYGEELIRELEAEIERYENQMSRRWDRINNGETDQEDCFVSMRVEERGRDLAKDKIKLIQNGGFDWFVEYATLDDVLVNAKWCQCRSFTGYGKTSKLRVEMPDGTVKWTQATTEKGLARIGIKRVLCKRPAWFRFSSGGSGMYGIYTGQYTTFPSDKNYATGEDASKEPVEMKDYTPTKGERKDVAE